MANTVGVQNLLEQLKAKFGQINADIEQDQFKKAAAERQLVGLTDSLEDTNNLLAKQRKLLRQYNNNLDEAEAAIRNLNKQSAKFENSYHKINKTDKTPVAM
jgi:chromosome segregation ATPase